MGAGMTTALPQLLDVWSSQAPLKPGVERIVRNATPTARRFIFDPDSSHHVGSLLLHAADLVAEQITFAKPPYPNTYIEITDARAMFHAWRPSYKHDPISSDIRLGFLYTGDRMYVFIAGEGVKAELGMFSITMGHGQTAPLSSIFGDHPSITHDPAHGITWQHQVKLAYLLGGMRQYDSILMPQADYQWFLDNYDLQGTLDLPPGDRARRDRIMIDAAFLGGGDLLIGAACLLLIHGNKRGVSVQGVPHHRGWWKGKQIVYKAHSVVTIKLGPKDTIRRVAFGNRESPRRHEVMGTWVHYHKEGRCEHDWVRLDDPDHERYQCSRCPTLRTWRASHVRGDGGKGIVTKEYEVTK